MVNIVIAGLPKNVKIPKFVSYLERTVFHEILNARHVHTMHVDNNIKNITLGLRSNDARKARRYLHGFLYQYAGKEYPLQCWQGDYDNNPQPKDRNEMDYTNTPANENFQNDSEPSQNPSTLKRELQEIDLKIEIVKRQRILLEEENKLLLAQKKSELLNKIGPNDYENLVKLEKVCGLKDLNEIEKIQPTPATNTTTNAKKKSNIKLPNFKTPCRIIIKEMKDVLDDYVKPDNRDMVMSLIYSAIRKRLILVLQGKSFMPAPDIIHLYRVKYPHSTDKNLLEELMETISQSFWPKTPSVNTNDNDNSQIKTKDEDTVSDLSKNIKEDENDTGDTDDVQVINDNNDGQVIDVNSLNNVEKIETQQESENHKSDAETNRDEKTIESLDNVDAAVDMDNDFDEWEDNEIEGDSTVEKEAADAEL
ncbi:uncharacterized protein LOC123667461 [Melitaea cinxia]|uniref:uncharacterized protein LOC123667461 n=1 Tax=Melitaea cinxia TaxID=113334 RepID=UPI001E271B4F|nr:uncharacterized protein LOC123667461 [Melitaea cinxia]